MFTITYPTTECCIEFTLEVDYTIRRGLRASELDPGFEPEIEIRCVAVERAWVDFNGAQHELKPDAKHGWLKWREHFTADLPRDKEFVSAAIAAAQDSGAVVARG